VSQFSDSDLSFLSQAFDQARKGRGFCAPNPSVGAIVVKEGKVIARGFHSRSGAPHAEVEALKQISDEQAQGSTIYVSLEPCCHHGKTPPCTELLIQKKIGRVVFGYQDPNPAVSGQGLQSLLEHGIRAELLKTSDGDAYYESYSYWTQNKMPWVTAKLALSLDGKIAGKNGAKLTLTSSVANAFTHLCRKETDAILTTAKTILKDNPQLNARFENESFAKSIYVLDRNFSLSGDEKIFSTAAHVTLFCSEPSIQIKKTNRWNKNVSIIPTPEENQGLDLSCVLSHIAKDGKHELWIEAGGVLFEKIHEEKLVKRTLIYTCPVWIGEEGTPAFRHSEAPFLNQVQTSQWQSLGHDGLLEIRW
jgi:diaminohydroxyphosphoribosylaminopyrimidine deaminase / 5-amino-6-(5-phosphoribosylamino)uracil reductase